MAREREPERDTEPFLGPAPTLRRNVRPRGRRRPPSFSAGDQVDQYRIVRMVAQGGMGEVYLARDEVLGRRAALKVVRPEELGSPRAKERFLLEAQATARFNHPHIVTIYGVGEHQGKPYVALEYLEGQNLHERLREGRPALPEALRISLAVAEALAEAHRAGVLHRDLKPSNVIVPKDGRLRVVDFGIAKVSVEEDEPDEDPTTPDLDTPSGSGGAGTPEFMAPEQWEMRELGPKTDVFALGLLIFELVAGHGPFDAPVSTAPIDAATRPRARGGWSDVVRRKQAVCSPEPAPRLEGPGLPTLLVQLVSQCLAKEQDDRPTAAEAAEVLRQLLRSPRLGEASDDNPFRGLAAFTERQAHLFFGRSAEVEALTERLRTEPLLALVGRSGAGKSSLVQAGLVPRLREQGPVLLLSMRPGSRPFATLAARLSRAGADTVERGRISEPPDSSRGRGSSPPGSDPPLSVSPLIDSIAPPVGPRIVFPDLPSDPPSRPSLLPIAEGVSVLGSSDTQDLASRLRQNPAELGMTLRRLADERGSKVVLFVDQLEEAVTQVADPEERRAFVETLCSAADDPADPVRIILAVRDDFLGRIAMGPRAQEAFASIFMLQPVAAEALTDVLTEPLAIVGYRFEDPELPLEMVRAVASGGGAGLPLLQFAAERLWEHRDTKHKLISRAAYEQIGGVEGALARHADGVVERMTQEGQKLARAILLRLVTPERTRRSTSIARAVAGLPAESRGVLDDLVGARLVSVLRAKGVAPDDALVELTHESLVSTWGALARWLDEGREEVLLLRELHQAAEAWNRRGRRDDDLWRGEVLSEAVRRVQRHGAPPSELGAAFLGAATRMADRGRRRVRYATLAGLTLLAGVATIASLTSLYFGAEGQRARDGWTQAEHARAEVSQQRAAGLREGARAALAQGDPLEARAKVRLALEIEDDPSARTLFWTLERQPLLWRRDLGPALYVAEISPDGRTVATAGQSKVLYLVDSLTSRETRLRGHDDQILAARFSGDGKILASIDWSGGIRIWDVATQTEKRSLRAPKGGLHAMSLSADGKLLAVGGDDALVHLWDLTASSAAPLASLVGHAGPVRALVGGKAGDLLVSIDKTGRVLAWKAPWGSRPRTVTTMSETSLDMDLSPDQKFLAVGSEDNLVHVVDLESGAEVRRLRGHSDNLMNVRYSSDGKTIVSGGQDHTARVWDAKTGAPLGLPLLHGDYVHGLSFDPTGRFVATASHDGSLRMFQVDRLSQAEAGGGHLGAVGWVSTSPRGDIIASGGTDRSLRIWDRVTGHETRVFPFISNIMSVSWSGSELAALGADNVVRTWNLDTDSREPTSLRPVPAANEPRQLSPDGNLFAAEGKNRSVIVWDRTTGIEQHVLTGHTSDIRAIAWGPKQQRLAAGAEGGDVILWDLASEQGRHLVGHTDAVWAAAFSADGKKLATAGFGGSLWVWDTETGEGRALAQLPSRIYDVKWDPTGEHVAVTCSDSKARIVAIGGGSSLELVGHQAEVNRVAWTADGKAVVTGGDDGAVRLWDPTTGRSLWHTVALAPGPVQLLTHEGWLDLDGKDTTVAVHPDPAKLPAAAWRTALQGGARGSAVHRNGKTLCVARWDGTVELWDMTRDTRVASAPLGQPEQVLALSEGCALRAGGKVALLTAQGALTELPTEGEVTTIGGGSPLLVGVEGAVLAFDDNGAVTHKLGVAVGATALGNGSEGAVVGYRDGAVAVQPWESTRARWLERVPASPARIIVPGPPGTLIVGYVSGEVGLWSERDGSALVDAHLHGPIDHVLVEAAHVHVASELGAYLTWDLEAFEASRCDVLRRVWASVPVTWEDGAPLLTPPPTDHPCASAP